MVFRDDHHQYLPPIIHMSLSIKRCTLFSLPWNLDWSGILPVFFLNNFTFTNIIKIIFQNSHILVSLNVDILHDQCTITYAIKLTLIQSYQLIYKKFYQLSHVGRQNSVVPKISSPSCSTHFLLVIQSNTNLSAAMEGFCSCN